ncbi:AhpC/TSA family protein [Mucilaginibacter sp. RS28]|uniref:AhpC/TSA family protein n=1 Tax=Mucilaginibacter straminoryzae TaxID=2932774 RepID=A0A9X1X270_9SPHI|nr:TlpA disulfide reductase family protein [Mucilaginibacter straminoryzae]MCJ8209486.1 AhpC/TSA family protein [Mucilaginibacter straminoryzae]
MKLNKAIYGLLIAGGLVWTGCSDKSAFKVEGEVKDFGKSKKVTLLSADSVIDSTQLGSDGKFEFKQKAPFAGLYRLRIGGNLFDFIAKNGDEIKFSTDLADSAHTYNISGSDDSEKIRDFNKISSVYGAKNTQLMGQYQEKAQTGVNENELAKEFTPLFVANIRDYSEAVLKFVNDNKSSLAGFYAINTLDPMRYETQMVKYADDIKGKFPDNPSVQKFIKQMMLVKPVSVGQPAPDFTSNTLNDKPVKLSDYKGKYVLLDFWASWCPPCRQENPNVVRLYNQYHSKGLNILSVSLDTEKADWQKAIKADKLNWEHVSDLQKFEGPTETLYRIEAIPSNFLIDQKGVIIAKNVSGEDLEEILKKTFNKP